MLIPRSERLWDVLVLGDANPDLILRGDVTPRFGQAEQILSAADLVLGGSAAITACGTARLGLRTALRACVGSDDFAQVVTATLVERGVSIDQLQRPTGGRTGISIVLSTTGDRAMLTFPGVIPALSADDIDDDVLASAGHVHISSFFLMPGLASGAADLFERAHRVGTTTSLDTNWDPAGKWTGVTDTLRHTDVFLPNVSELLALTGMRAKPGDSDDELIAAVTAAAEQIGALGPYLAVKAGALGGLGWGPDGAVSAPAIPVDVRDTTGAGDSFVAGFLAAYLRGQTFAKALSWAAAAGSLSTRAAGGTGAQATAEELSALAPPGRPPFAVREPAESTPGLGRQRCTTVVGSSLLSKPESVLARAPDC